MPEATLRETKFGRVYDGEGWFVLNASDSRWSDSGPFGFFCNFEGKRPFRQFGINLSVLEPGQPLSLYHRERAQEGFLVLAGECLLIVEGEERPLSTWDYFHCAGGTAHIVVGAGTGPAVVLSLGGRGGRKGVEYLADPVALARDAAVRQDTTKWSEAYAAFPRWFRCRYREGWLRGSEG